MVRCAAADDHLKSYFYTVAKQDNFSVGLILGQTLAGKDYIVHFAKSPPFQVQDGKENETTTSRVSNIEEVNAEWMAEHARLATRMLPGGMYVLGMYVVSSEDLLNPFNSKIKNILNGIVKHLETQPYLFGNPRTYERLVLNFCTNTQQFTCKSYDIMSGSVQPVEMHFIKSKVKWINIECMYQMDQIYQAGGNENDWSLKKHMDMILDAMDAKLRTSVFLYDGELKEGDETIDSIGKRKISRSNKSSSHDDHSKPLQVCIMQRCDSNKSEFNINETANQIKIFGHVVTKLWFTPKMPVYLVSEAIKEDIMRSLSTRLDMHWNSLTEEEHGEDMISVHEPPRRVLIQLPHSHINVSDYLFPGEGPHDAKMSLDEILDIKVYDELNVDDVEGQADLTDYYTEAVESESEEQLLKKPTRSNNFFYYIGLLVALLVLIISTVIHFIQENQQKMVKG